MAWLARMLFKRAVVSPVGVTSPLLPVCYCFRWGVRKLALPVVLRTSAVGFALIKWMVAKQDDRHNTTLFFQDIASSAVQNVKGGFAGELTYFQLLTSFVTVGNGTLLWDQFSR